MSPEYTHGHDASVLRSHSWRTAENSAGYLLPHLHAGMSLLDVGCGPGTITVDLARRVAPGRVVGIDPSAEALQQASAAAVDAHVEVEFAATDIEGWQNSGAPFDVVHAHQVLQHLPDPVDALRRMRTFCAAGGLVAARDADYGGMFWYPDSAALDEWRDLYRAVARGNGGEPDAARHLAAWARAADFADITVSGSTWVYSSHAEIDWWAGTWAERIERSHLADGAVAQGLASREELRRLASGWREWAARPDALFVVPHVEILCRA